MKCKEYPLAKKILFFSKYSKIINILITFKGMTHKGNKAPVDCELQVDQLGLVICAMIEYLNFENNQLIETIKKEFKNYS